MSLPTHIRVWLAAASLCEAGHESFSGDRLKQEYRRMFGDVTTTVQTFISAHANSSSPKNNPTVYNYLARIEAGEYSMCNVSDTVHASRQGAALWPDQARIPTELWPLWSKITARQRNLAGAAQSSVAATALPDGILEPVSGPTRRPKGKELVGDAHSVPASYQDAMLEQLLVGELMRKLWPIQLEVLKPEMVHTGYGLTLECQGVLRHVQLRSSFEWTSSDQVNADASVFKKLTGCVVWTRFDRLTLSPVEFRWIGGRPGEQSSQVSQSRFSSLDQIEELIECLFGFHPGRPSNGTDAEMLVAYIQSLSQFRMERSTAGDYRHMGATITESILQAGIDYRSVVRPRVDALIREHPEANTTSRFLELLFRVGPGQLLNFSGPKPERVVGLTQFLVSEGVETELSLKDWLLKVGNSNRLIQLSGVGPKTVDYLQILVGIDNTAVDRHLADFVSRAGGVANTYAARKDVIEQAATLLGVEKSVLDYSIWLYMSDLSRGTRSQRSKG